MAIWLGFLLVIAYSLLKSCLRGSSVPGGDTGRPAGPSPSLGHGWFPGDNHGHDGDSSPPPPPYSKNPSDASQSSSYRPGFWTGAAVGGLGASLLNNRRQTNQPQQRQASYDWEQSRPSNSFMQRSRTSDDRGEGSSNLGAMRSSTGLGGSNVR